MSGVCIPHCRVGRVRMKAGGADVRVIRHAPPENAIFTAMETAARQLREKMPDMVGYAIVTWDQELYFARATHWRPRSPVGRTFLPGFVAEVLRRDTVEDVVRERFDVKD